MARNPLYPRTPGEQAVDRFLNDTLPRLLQARKQEQMDREKFEYKKEQDIIQNAQWAANFKYKKAQDIEDDTTEA